MNRTRLSVLPKFELLDPAMMFPSEPVFSAMRGHRERSFPISGSTHHLWPTACRFIAGDRIKETLSQP